MRGLPERRTLVRLGWFVGLWLAGVASVAALAGLLKLLVPA